MKLFHVLIFNGSQLCNLQIFVPPMVDVEEARPTGYKIDPIP
jgi:hypothetical protein